MTITQDLGVFSRDRGVGPQPSWVAGAFAGMYPDSLSTSTAAATVLATDEDWDAIAGRDQAVGAVIDQTIAEERGEAGQWLVREYVIDGVGFTVATAIADADHRSVGVVVLVATAATIKAHTATKARR